MCEEDLDPLAARLTDDIELDPSLPRYEGYPEGVNRGIALRQFHGRAVGAWTAGSWRLLLVAEHGGEVVGSQDLKGDDFLRRRTVGTASYLVAHRGRGFGRQMRLAVLALAFDGLGALAAETEAWHDNAASLGVSAACGYEPNGETLHVRGDGVDRMVRMRLTRERWQQGGAAAQVRVDGLEACLPMFGLARTVPG
jgi:RimJ/RimL family protein N-acetyltransferase